MEDQNQQQSKQKRKIKQFKKIQKMRYYDVQQTPENLKNFFKEEMQPEIIRKIIKDHGDLSGRKFKKDKRIYLGAMKYLPHAVFKLLENMPMPWEEVKYVKCVYHETGALTIIDEVPKAIESVFTAQWASCWTEMRKEKKKRVHFKRMRFPPFDDEEPPLSYGDNILDLEPPEPINMKLDEKEDDAIYDCFYDDKPFQYSEFVNGESYKSWNFTSKIQKNLFRISYQLLGEVVDKNCFYLFDKNSFITAKSLNQTIPGGPKFEPMFPQDKEDYEEDWNEFNDIKKVIHRNYIRTEYRVAFPHLYNSKPRKVRRTRHRWPLSAYQPFNNFSEKIFKMRKNINLFTRQKRKKIKLKQCHQNDLKRLNESITSNFTDLLEKCPLEPEGALEGMAILWAPKMFQKRKGKTRRVIDIPLIRPWYRQRCSKDNPVKVRVSYQKLLKNWVLNDLHKQKPKNKKKNKLTKEFIKTKYFQKTEMDWLEAGLQLVRQAFNMMNLIIHKRNLTFLHLDYNFSLKPVKTLTTKERKKSRFGNSFHLMREIMRLVKFTVDAHARYRLGEIDAFELADGLYYIFSHVGNLTGMYRYKYKMMKQIRMTKDLKHVINSRFKDELVGRGPGCGFWAPLWRVWIFFMRGTIPILERWLGNLLARQFEGRHSKHIAKTVTKQRVESNFDLELRSQLMREIIDVMPVQIRSNKAKVIMQHLSEAWRCWKSNYDWKVPGMPPLIESIILKYVKMKADWWTKAALLNRRKIREGFTIDKTVCKKNVGRLSRLYFKNEQARQQEYLRDGPFVSSEEAVAIYSMFIQWLDDRKFQTIPFPPINYKHDTKLFILGLERLKESFVVKSRLNQNQRDQLALVEQALENPHEYLARIKRQLLMQRTFKEVKMQFMDLYSHLLPIYQLNPMEKITDSYLDQYLWYESSKRNLFPNWVKPSDNEPAPLLVYKFCQGINNIDNIWETRDGSYVVLMKTKLMKLFQKCDLNLLNKLLRLVMDHNLADYMTSKNNVKIAFKDMAHVNSLGIIHGLNFSGYLVQFWGLIVDLMIMGSQRAQEMAGDPLSPNDFMSFESQEGEKRHPLKAYCRCTDEIYMIFKFSKVEAEELTQRYLSHNPDPFNENLIDFPRKLCWPKDQRMRMLKFDVNLAKAVFWEIKNRLPESLVEMKWCNTEMSVFSHQNPNLVFEMCDFEIRIQPETKYEIKNQEMKDGMWRLVNEKSKKTTAIAHLQVSQKAVKKFQNRIRQIFMSSGSTTFTKIVNKWNTSLNGLIVYFREALVNTQSLLDLLVRSENKIQNRIKMGINSKMPARFPPCIFYSPKELGGLGMLSMGHILIPQADLFFSSQTQTKITHFRAGMSHQEDRLIPNIYRYIQTWESEFRDSKRVWMEYSIKRQQAIQNNTRLDISDLEDAWDFGVPRINTLFQKDRLILAYDRGWRIRQEFKKYQIMKQNPFWWTHQQHDGKLWNLNNYRRDVIDSLGGVESILEHTLFKATYFQSWEGLFWEKASGFEESMKYKQLTNAQRSGLNQIPNRRFTLWWSPTINRANVYIGYTVQLDLTGILMHGKLPNLKISLVQIFRAHLWQKIHESLVLDYCQILDQEMDVLEIDQVQKETIHPRKSYKLEFSCADIVINATHEWNITKPSLLHETKDVYQKLTSKIFWIDIQLRWGDFDSHNIERYTRAKYLEYTTDSMSLYPSKTGLVIGFDLCYNQFSAYGNWFPGLKQLILEQTNKIMNSNSALFVLRERIRKALQLHTTEPTDPYLNSTNYSELFSKQNTLIVDDSNVIRVISHKTLEGNLSTKPVNGVLFIFNPKNGRLFMKIIHNSVWTGQKRRGQLAKWKAAEEVAALVRSMPSEERPSKIIVMRKSLLDPLELQLLDFPNIIIKGSEIQIPFQSLIKLQKFGGRLRAAKEPEMVLYNMYDDWTDSVSNFVCFNRTILIMRSLHVSDRKTVEIMEDQQKNQEVKGFVWPKIEINDWPKAEIQMRNIILGDFSKRCNVNIASLTQSEIRDIILGMETSLEDIQQRQIEEIKNQKNQLQSKIQTITQTVNKQGVKVVVPTTTPYEQEQFKSQKDWRIRALTIGVLRERSKEIVAVECQNSQQEKQYIIPENITKKLVQISDFKSSVCGLLFGKEIQIEQEMEIIEIHSLILVPQSFTKNHIQFNKTLPQEIDHLMPNLSFVGFIYTKRENQMFLNPRILKEFYEILQVNQVQDFLNKIIVELSYPMGNCLLKAFQISQKGIQWAKKAEKEGNLGSFNEGCYGQIQIWISNTFEGYFLTPEDTIWNKAFQGFIADNQGSDYGYEDPQEFYDDRQRLNHFINFCRNQIEDY